MIDTPRVQFSASIDADAAAPLTDSERATLATRATVATETARPRTRGKRGKRGRKAPLASHGQPIRHTFAATMRVRGGPDYVSKARAIEARIIDAIDRRAADAAARA